MNLRKFVVSDNISGMDLGLNSSVFLFGFIGVILLPFYIYVFGAGILWEYMGVLIAMVVVWNFEGYRLMRYARKHHDIISLPGYFSRRFSEKHDYIRVISACEIIILTALIDSLILKEGGIIISTVTGLSEGTAKIVIMLFVAFLFYMFGYKSLQKSAVYKGTFFLIIVLALGVYMYTRYGGLQLIRNMMQTDITGSVSEYLNFFFHDGKLLQPGDYVSLISMGMLAGGMPYMLSGFFIAKDSDTVTNGKRIVIVYIISFVVLGAVMGAFSRGYIYFAKIEQSLSGYVKLMTDTMIGDGALGIVAAILYMTMIVIGLESTIEACFQVCVASIYEDILRKGRILRVRKRYEKMTLLIIVISLAVAMLILSECISSFSINTIIFFIGALGCSIMPTVFMSLVWRRMNRFGCVAGLLVGVISVPFFKYASVFVSGDGKAALCDILGINAVIPSMLFSFGFIILVSLITPAPAKPIVDEFNDVRNRIA